MKERISARKELFCAILFVGFLSCIFAPFEIYTINSQDLWFSLKDFWYIPLACGIFAMTAAALMGCLLKGKLLKIYTAVIFGTGICIYIQGNFLNLKLGMMTGASIDWTQYRGRLIFDVLFWIILICICIVLCLRNGKYIQKIIMGVSLFLTAVLFVTLAVLVVPCLRENKTPACGYPTDKNLTALSGDTNVLVFVLDYYDVDFFKQALEEVPEFEEQLDGFVWYDNFAGCYCNTQYAIPFMLSGRYYPLADVPAYLDTLCAEEVYWDALIQNGYEMSLYSNSDLIPERAGANAVNFVKTDFKIANHKAFTVLLYRLVMCKYFPDIVKPYVWLYGYEFDHRRQLQCEDHYYTPENLTLVDYLDRQPVTADADCPQFKFIHVSGVHAPHAIDEWGHRTEETGDENTSIKGSLRLVFRYLDEMESLNIYDNTAVIITADHGRFTADCTSPVFLVKPRSARGRLKSDHTPASQVDLGATILDLADIDTDAYGVSVFDTDGENSKKRYYYKTIKVAAEITGKSPENMIEYEVDHAGISLENFYLTGVEYDANGKIQNDK